MQDIAATKRDQAALARKDRISFASYLKRIYLHSLLRAHPSGRMDFYTGTYFFPLRRRPSGARANLRLAIRRTTAWSQEALIFQRKRASASRRKKKVRETQRERERKRVVTRSFEKERGKRSGRATRAKRRPAEVNRQQAPGMKTARGFSMESGIVDTLLRDADVT